MNKSVAPLLFRTVLQIILIICFAYGFFGTVMQLIKPILGKIRLKIRMRIKHNTDGKSNPLSMKNKNKVLFGKEKTVHPTKFNSTYITF